MCTCTSSPDELGTACEASSGRAIVYESEGVAAELAARLRSALD